jgi:type I restriction-modification system DNA methylase subunit
MIDLNKYLAELQAHLKTGEAREHTYRPALISLFESFNDIQAANDQARTAHGATDFVYRSKSNLDIVLGYGEAKDINVSLDKTEKTEQLDRYSGYNNLLLTNGIEFRFYKNGKRYSQVEVAKLKGLGLTAVPENFQSLTDEIQSFFEQPPEVIKSGKRLSEIMGAKARRIRTNINILLGANAEDETKAAEISKVYQLMKNLLVHDLEPDKFADMYAQTLVYGLFVARYNDKTPENFSRVEARDLIPASNPFLREFFDHIAGPRFEKGLSIIVDELCQVFSVSNVKDIIDKHLKLNESDQTDAKDPIIHFYEDFLSEYNPVERKKMGAYYTPIPVVQYMVRAVDEVLKTHFNLPKGLADSSTETYDVVSQGKKAKQTYHKVQILDPATGTATFLNETIKFVADKFKGQEGMWPDYAKNNLIPRLHGFELMMGAYTIAHLKLGLTLKNLGVDDIGKRLGVYLTNSLEEGIPHQPDLFSFGLAEAVTHESAEAAHIKSERPIMVVIGNPPYSVSSNNKSDFIQNLIKEYKKDLNERKINLDDDYIKFIRFSEDLIEKNGSGVVAMITNNSFIDGVTHRQMRKHLLQTFDDIYIIDLHGNSKKKEVSPDGSKDENVFDIQQGVSINIFIKNSNKKSSQLANVYHKDLFGKRNLKFSWLNQHNLNNSEFKRLDYDDKYYFFVPKDFKLQEEYERYFKIVDFFNSSVSGMQTKRDALTISTNKRELEERLKYILENNIDSIRSHFSLPLDGRDWRIEWAKLDIERGSGKVTNVLYRPFDIRFTYYSGLTKGFIAYPRYKENSSIIDRDNVSILATRQLSSNSWHHTFISNELTEMCTLSNKGKETQYTFPLWLYDEQGNKSSNLNADIVQAIKLKVPDCDEQQIFDYIYGVLHWPAYRTKYKEFLKIDFPRVPYPKTQAEFDKFKLVGERLRQLHLMLAPDVDDYITSFPEPGTNQVVKLKYVCHPELDSGSPTKDSTGRVYINETQYFGGVPETAWNFYIGGYQPAQKWLKDRKGRELGFEDIIHYQRIIKVLDETGKVMGII